MKTRSGLSSGLIAAIILVASQTSHADRRVSVATGEFGRAASTLPDLIVTSVDSANLDAGEVKIKIKNQGQRRAVRSDVSLTITWGTNTASFTHSSIPLNAGQTDTVSIEVKTSVVQAKFCATADGTNKVTEANEDNNKKCGQFGGKL